MSQTKPAILVLADGTVFRGISIGADGSSVGEVVFNTSMTGYQEILTDPSYCSQIVTLTYPHIGNVGCNPEDVESSRVFASGLIIRDLSMTVSNFRATQSLPEYLKANNVVAIAGIDTRKLTRILRSKGAQNGCIASGDDVDAALKAAKGFAGLAGMDLAQVVTCDKPYEWTQREWKLGEGYSDATESKFHVVAYDFGVKRNILRMLAERGCRITVVPAKTSAEEVLKMKPDGVFLSNGPGDPEPCDYAIAAAKRFLEVGMPMYGICLGHQIMGLACGAKTVKMKFGHRGANHPVQDTATKRVMITSQNHGFAVDATTLPANARVTHISLFDGTLQGFELADKPAFCFQGHPEASPGPHDVDVLFDRFVAMMGGK
ncbi:MAG: glutamine-hydrolyzing carbamoyl-phosphate synthase small subunit [Gammaproteobacteria bacterium]|nr:glutamine-hydrolyzing carbamoyl-phosphate synthase small subunit [Sideroxydans sp.]MBU3903163.1 glutamine-hydrolyzing carbamoyl-phosphate synthase small subunit [Gammaproteobacteria bacterium]MBU4045035.1 glutamine-hydrolyzing carbamoyl-phosphate synthase small subunit [Gammaproteobacteria bacterium]MBU4150938.1 glutamine-hydrolyzing carbamoyl-phosphate synthase small subunit [Gammaproteobacteria bacterium]